MHSHFFEPGAQAGRRKHASVSIVDGWYRAGHSPRFENNQSGTITEFDAQGGYGTVNAIFSNLEG